MQLSGYLSLLILLITTAIARKAPESILLSSVKSLTLRKDLKTTNNRVSAVPQLSCVGGSAQGLYEIDVLRCKNSGSAYGDEDIQWTCSASLPSEFKLGSTEVICEGFKNSDDPYVLKGSCGVEYRLVLTDVGEEKYGRKEKDVFDDYNSDKGSGMIGVIFWLIFIVVLFWILYAACLGNNGRPRAGNDRPGFFGGGGGDDDPPPPYDDSPPPPKPKTSSFRPATSAPRYTPGFWSGAAAGGAAGGAAGYMAGSRGQNQEPRNQTQNVDYGGNGEGSSRRGGGGSIRSSSGSGMTSNYGPSRHESAGFGGTSRR